ncbi:MAG: C25 family cysteine peptidase, partial [bacterium]
MKNALQPLIDWKKRKGHTVVLELFTPGASTSQIKSIIQNAYDTWDIPPEFVLLVGDTSGDHTLAGWSPSGVDHPYSQLDGNDVLADVAVGRLPVENINETNVMVNKVLFYEKIPYTTHPEWYKQAVLVAGSSSSGLSTIQTNRWIKTRLIWNEYARIDTFWYNMSGSSVAATITTAINNGVTYCNYRGYWGMENFEISHIDNLTNGFKLPFCTILTCGTGGFDGDSFMEHFVSVGTASTPKGAVATVGIATLGTHTKYNNTLDVGMYAGIFDEDITQAGNCLVRGKYELYLAYQQNSPGSVSDFSLWSALAGDPGLELYTGAIQYMDCTIPATVNWGENLLTLTVNKTGVGPLPEAVVCLYKGGDTQAVGLTDANGQVTLPLNVVAAGNVKVTITKQNFYPIVDSLDVVQSGAVVGYQSHTIDDDNSGSSSGDSDAIINPGENVEIPLVFKNFGSSTPASNIVVTAQASDPYAVLTDSIETFPNLAPGASGNSADDLDLSISANCPHGHVVRLNFNTSSSQGAWAGVLDLPVISYEMSILSAQTTGSDTLLAPGETADFNLTVRNNGGKTASLLTATIVSLDSNVTVNDNSAAFGSVNVGAMASSISNPFNLTASPLAPMGWLADLQVTFNSASGALQTDTITIVLGAKVSTDPQGPDNYGYYCFDNTDVYYPQAPFFNWIEIDPNHGGTGSQLNLNDNGYQEDACINVTLPFTFRYYG